MDYFLDKNLEDKEIYGKINADFERLRDNPPPLVYATNRKRSPIKSTRKNKVQYD